ncbi:MAG: hypothetical protein ABN482_12525 [Corticimicrobacter sp.]|uniref:3-oxoacyl-ACP synthase III family protein n=1 Tax=Corticimicrobacter sp. TaxID=2678536 RepID=UPI0032D9F1B5
MPAFSKIGILGCGAAFPDRIRHSDDPIYASIKRHPNAHGVIEADTFTGVRQRHVLSDGQSLMDLASNACQAALARACMTASQIDRLYGYLSVSEYLTPNALFAVHRQLKLPDETMVIPINSEFSNFLLSLIQAWEAIACGHSRSALISCATNWSAHMDYTQGHAISIGDGAGAVLVGPDAPFEIVDYAVQTLSARYGAMTMQSRPREDMPGREHATYRIAPEAGLASYAQEGMEGPIRLIQGLLARHDIAPDRVGLFMHQATRMLLDHWHTQIGPSRLYESLETHGNMTFVSVPANLALHWDAIKEDYLVLHALGTGFHQIAVLLRRVPRKEFE